MEEARVSYPLARSKIRDGDLLLFRPRRGLFGRLIAKAGPVDRVEMFRVFNMGVGLALVVAPGYAGPIMSRLRKAGERCWVLGKVVPGGPALRWS